ILPPGELIYIVMSLVASSLWRNNNCPTVTFATMSSMGVPMKMIRSFKRREKMSQPRSPRGVDSTTLGIMPLGSRISALPLIHLGSLGLKTAPILTPSYLKQRTVCPFLPLVIRQVIPSAKNEMCRGCPHMRVLYRNDS